MNSHEPGAQDENCHRCAIGFASISVRANLAMAGTKLVAGILTGSSALTAASLYSFNDFFSAVIARASLSAGRRPADKDYAYGHGKIEFLAVAGMSFLLAGGVFLVMYESVINIVEGANAPPHIVAGGVAIIAAIGNWLLAKKAFCSARYLHSPTLHTCAEHHEADALSSLAVMIGVMAGAIGYHSIDKYIAIFETVHVLVLSGTLLGRSINGLMDRSIPDGDLATISQVCRQTPGVVKLIDIRARMAGCHAWADICLAVPNNYNVAAASSLCEKVGEAVRNSLAVEVETHIRFRPEDCLRGFEQKLKAQGQMND